MTESPEQRDETHVEQHGDGDNVVNVEQPVEQPEQDTGTEDQQDEE